MKQIIYFVGLIAHLTYGPAGGEKQVAALVYEKDHQPELVVSKGGVQGSSNPFTQITKSDKEFDHFDLTDVGVIQILGMEADDDVKRTTAFDHELVGLQAATGNGDLKSKIKDEKLKSGWFTKAAWAYVELHGGTLDVAGYFPRQGSYAGRQPVCIPSVLKLTADAPGKVVEFVSSDGHNLRIATGATILIRNLPTAKMAHHFENYEKLLDVHQHLGAWTQGDYCRTQVWMDSLAQVIPPDSQFPQGEGVDCTNTHFP